jgi:hypothetical protein
MTMWPKSGDARFVSPPRKQKKDTTMSSDSELLVGLSVEELEALADSLLAPAAQAQLDDLLARQKEKLLSADEERALDGLLKKVDQLTILKTRARYTLKQESTAATRT